MARATDIKRIHMIGIGGIGMSGLARLLKSEGREVSGSDQNVTPITCGLEALGIEVKKSQSAENIGDDIELVIYTEAMPEDHEEMAAAREKGIPMMNYFQALGEIANEYYLIAVAGTHGKTTTTAMLIDILEEASYDPTAIVGALRTKTGSNFRPGKSKYFIVEACEYKRDFLTLQPDILIITNIEHEHVDYYKDLREVQDAFYELVQKVHKNGVVIVDTSDSSVTNVLEGVKANVIDYCEYVDVMSFLHLPGLHNRLNAAAASAAAAFLGIEKKYITEALENFAGTERRFEYKGLCNNAYVYDDYAHHPTEIAASVSGTRDLHKDKKLTVVFQPHTYSRTHELFDDFADVLSKADRVLLVPIYAAREDNTSGVSSEQLSEALRERGVDSKHFHTLAAAAQEVKDTVNKNDVVVVMGAGDVTKVADLLV